MVTLKKLETIVNCLNEISKNDDSIVNNNHVYISTFKLDRLFINCELWLDFKKMIDDDICKKYHDMLLDHLTEVEIAIIEIAKIKNPDD